MDSDKIRYFFPKVKNRLRVERNRLWKYCNVEHLALFGFIPFENAGSFKARLQGMLGVYDSDLLANITREENQTIISTAELSFRHEFNLLGSGSIKLDPIDWHIDFKSGKRWRKSFYCELPLIQDADIKVPWELSRCQHLLWLGEAYLLTGDEKYAKEVVDEIKWWIKDNPFLYSVNWKCSMDVAIRAVNWMYALNTIVEYEGFDNQFTQKVSKSLWQHGFFIRNNLEKQIPYSNNHYASDIVGLLYIGCLFKGSDKGKRWFRFAKNEFFKEIRSQVLPSGVHYERSVSYHRLMTELISYPAYMLQRVCEMIPDDIHNRIQRMYEYVATYTKPNGKAPLVADNDDGRFVPFVKRDFRRHNYLNDPQSVENRFVAVDCKLYSCNPSGTSQCYPDAGVAVIRKGDNYLYVNNGGYSKRPKDSDMIIGTHTHNDLLSFELSMKGKDVLVDAGTFLYTSSKISRDEFRSTSKHNTLVVDGEEQNAFYGAFELKRNILKGELRRLGDGLFEGEYTTLVGQMHHKRFFDFSGDELIIQDTIKKDGEGHEACLYFHFAEGASAIIKDSGFTIKDRAHIRFDIVPDRIEVNDDTISPSFGELVNTITGVVTYKFENLLKIKTTIKALS